MAKILTTLKGHKGKIALVGVLLAVVAASITGKPPLEVSMAQVEEAPFTTYVEEAARAEASGARPIVALVTGEVAKTLVEPGDQVKAGTVLAQITATDLEFEERRLQSSLSAAQAQLAELKSGATGSTIKALEADLAAAKVELAEAERQWQKAKELFSENAMSEDQYQQAKAKVDSAKTAVNKAQANLSEAKSGGSANEVKQLEAQINGIRASLDLIRTQAGRTQLVSPIAGTVLEKNITTGAMVQPGTQAFVVGDVKALRLRSEILADDAVGIAEGQKVQVTGAVLGDRTLSGKVTKVYPQAVIKVSSLGIEQQRVPVEIELADTKVLKPNFEVEARIITGAKAKTLQIPEGAVFKVDGKEHCFVAEAGVARLQPIRTGLKNADQIEIITGLKKGQQVIVYPSSDVKAGVKVVQLQ